jgi:hypothetical protein
MRAGGLDEARIRREIRWIRARAEGRVAEQTSDAHRVRCSDGHYITGLDGQVDKTPEQCAQTLGMLPHDYREAMGARVVRIHTVKRCIRSAA